MSEIRALWIVIAATIAIDAVWLWLTGIKVHFGPRLVVGLIVLICINQIYTRFRPNKRIATVTLTFAQIIAFTYASCVLSYLAAAAKFPLVDHYLTAADRALGFDWLSFFNWVKSHAAVDTILEYAYSSCIVQIGILIATFIAIERFDRAREFAWLYVITLLIIVPLSLIIPAEGAWANFGVANLTSAFYLPDFYALRDGAMPVIETSKVTGIIQFPSFHATLGLILIIASRRTFLFPLYVPLNIVTIVSALTSGGHYLSDILAGLAVVPVAALLLEKATTSPSDLP